MVAHIKYSPKALLDLNQVFLEVYQASKDEGITNKYINELLDKINDISSFIESSSPLNYKELFTGYRFIVYKSYIAFYRYEDNTIFVDRILYIKRDYFNILGIK